MISYSIASANCNFSKFHSSAIQTSDGYVLISSWYNTSDHDVDTQDWVSGTFNYILYI
jgi:hypothetical protein